MPLKRLNNPKEGLGAFGFNPEPSQEGGLKEFQTARGSLEKREKRAEPSQTQIAPTTGGLSPFVEAGKVEPLESKPLLVPSESTFTPLVSYTNPFYRLAQEMQKRRFTKGKSSRLSRELAPTKLAPWEGVVYTRRPYGGSGFPQSAWIAPVGEIDSKRMPMNGKWSGYFRLNPHKWYSSGWKDSADQAVDALLSTVDKPREEQRQQEPEPENEEEEEKQEKEGEEAAKKWMGVGSDLEEQLNRMTNFEFVGSRYSSRGLETMNVKEFQALVKRHPSIVSLVWTIANIHWNFWKAYYPGVENKILRGEVRGSDLETYGSAYNSYMQVDWLRKAFPAQTKEAITEPPLRKEHNITPTDEQIRDAMAAHLKEIGKAIPSNFIRHELIATTNWAYGSVDSENLERILKANPELFKGEWDKYYNVNEWSYNFGGSPTRLPTPEELAAPQTPENNPYIKLVVSKREAARNFFGMAGRNPPESTSKASYDRLDNEMRARNFTPDPHAKDDPRMRSYSRGAGGAKQNAFVAPISRISPELPERWGSYWSTASGRDYERGLNETLDEAIDDVLAMIDGRKMKRAEPKKWTESELTGLNQHELRKLAKSLGIDSAGLSYRDVVDKILESQKG